ncbi:hypothetical protein INT48_008941 [Thamnidium elegans]|uniref:Actin interacting protein 3 C-terminal domain-containing protein n=1 Tax=Thamnidium elegans TaxID=101142 RepID=A0A8H7SK11_9FUNG|nr:hypothetical protein INT48_008941 [Thamnidium elegans]
MKRINSTIGTSGEIEQVVTKLLRTTKALLEALTQWSHLRASNTDIFEIHDTLEKQFFLVSQAFEESNVFMNDLQWIPRQLRDSVSVAMLEPPSPPVLDQYLPRIREVIVHLLHGLKGKQAMLRERERERESRGSIRSSSESWNREVPLAALNRGSGSQRMMMYPVPNSPPLPPISPRMNASNEYDPWSGGMPRPSMPTNDLSSRIMPRNNSVSRAYSPQQSPNIQHQPLPTRSTSSGRNNQPMTTTAPPPPPPPPPAPPVPPAPPAPAQQQQQRAEFDETDANTASALAALKRQENLARRSSVRRASMFRGNSEYNGGSISRGKQQYFQQQQQSNEVNVPPVPTLPINEPNRLNTVTEETKPVAKEKKPDGLTLFLQIGKEVQKVVYQGEISFPALNMLFLEKFSDSIRQNDFPKIYIRDPSIDVSYELVDLTEAKHILIFFFFFFLFFFFLEKEVQEELLLQVTTTFNKELEETRKIFVEQMEELKKQVMESSNKTEDCMKHMLSQPVSAPVTTEPVEEVSTKEDEESTPKEEEESTPNEEEEESIVKEENSIPKEQYESQLLEIETLRRDMSVLRQLEREMREGTASVIQEMKEKAEAVKEEAKKNKALELTQTTTRSHLEDGKKNLLEKSDKVTSRLEDLQDTIDQLKLDVTQRKCRPSETMMTHCANERKALSEEIEEFGKFITEVKPRWKKTWEQELQTIVKEQQTLKDQEYLLSDMKDDLDALLEVFEQLEKIYAYQASTKPQPREFRVAPVEEGYEGMASVFKQVSTIDVDHSRRLRALEQADKMRQRELSNRIDDFEKELVGFVGEKKLKKTGGALEIDRLRKQKDEEIMKAMYAANKKPATQTIEEEPEQE